MRHRPKREIDNAQATAGPKRAPHVSGETHGIGDVMHRFSASD
jgi:hypothetical protein